MAPPLPAQPASMQQPALVLQTRTLLLCLSRPLACSNLALILLLPFVDSDKRKASQVDDVPAASKV